MNTREKASDRRACGFALAALYAPYLLVFVLAEPAWVLVWIWPIFPGVAFLSILQWSGLFHSPPGLGWVIISAILILAATLLLACRFRTARALFLLVAALAILSLALLQVIMMLLRA